MPGCKNSRLAKSWPPLCPARRERQRDLETAGACLLEFRRGWGAVRRRRCSAGWEWLVADAGELVVLAPQIIHERSGDKTEEDGGDSEPAHSRGAGVRTTALRAGFRIVRVGVLALFANHCARTLPRHASGGQRCCGDREGKRIKRGRHFNSQHPTPNIQRSKQATLRVRCSALRHSSFVIRHSPFRPWALGVGRWALIPPQGSPSCTCPPILKTNAAF